MTVKVVIGSLPVIMLACSHHQRLIGERKKRGYTTMYIGVICISTCVLLYYKHYIINILDKTV